MNEIDGAPVRVKFGPRPGQDVPLEWAAAMLTGWRERDAYGFGQALLRVQVGEDALTKRKRNGQPLAGG